MAKSTKTTNFEKTTEFNKVLGQGVSDTPKIPSLPQCQLRMSLIDEEAMNEMSKALDDRNLVSLADAIGDALVVVYGAANDAGLDADAIFSIVHKSNMSKLCSTEKSAKESVEKYAKGNGFHGKHEPIAADYRESEDIKGKYIVFDKTTGKTLKGTGFKEPTAELENLIYPNGVPVSPHSDLIESAREKVKSGEMSGAEFWHFQESLEKL